MGFVLIKSGSQWPPLGYSRLREHWLAWRALWGGDVCELERHMPLVVPNGYWDKRRRHPETRAMHAALAGDIARTSADLVAGDTPTIDWGEDKGTAKAKKPTPQQDAWDEYEQTVGLANTLLEGAESASAVGGVFLRPAWDKDFALHALPTVVPADEALPEFRFGQLWRVAFVQRLPAPDGWTQIEKNEVWRWIEHHEPRQIRHELWLGNESSIGRLLDLTQHPATEQIQGVIDTSGIRPAGILVEHWPNVLPNPLVPMPLGRSDFQGCESQFDALDEAWSSWMRDIELGKARVLVAQEMLEAATPAAGRIRQLFGGKTQPAKVFDEDAKVFVGVPGMPMDEAGKPSPITPVEFKIRFEEHAATVAALVEAILSRAGYAPQTFGINVDGQLSGTAMRRREHRSYRTRDRKRRYGRSPLERFCETLAIINNDLNSAFPKPKARPTLVWREGDQADPKEIAEISELLRRAMLLSDEIGVRMNHPEWDDTQVDEEVDRLAKEREAATALAPSEFDHPEDDAPPKTDEE